MNDITDDPLDFASTLDDRFIKTGQDEGHHYGYQRGFRQAAYCVQLLGQLNSTNDSNPRQRRLLNGITESCREFRTLLPDAPRYAELLASIRARHQHLTGAGNNTIEAANLNF
ncbi:unnamed protein product [Rotaria socialis]